MHDLDLPPHLRRSKGDVPKPRPIRWRRVRAERPAGAKWETADRWSVKVPAGAHDPYNWTGDGRLAPGTRHLWVIEGSKWVELRDKEGYIKN